MPDKKTVEHIKLCTSPKIARVSKRIQRSSTQSRTKVKAWCTSDLGQLTHKDYFESEKIALNCMPCTCTNTHACKLESNLSVKVKRCDSTLLCKPGQRQWKQKRDLGGIAKHRASTPAGKCKLQATVPWLQACFVPTVLLGGTAAVRLFFLVPDDSYSDSCRGRSRKPQWKRNGRVKKKSPP